MEKRIGTITILILDRRQATVINSIISDHTQVVLCRQGLPFRDSEVAVIALIVEGTTNQINALTGQLGRLEGIVCKAVVAPQGVGKKAEN
ncbi:MAG: hypothetical protein IJU19_04570 [Bacteroidales bacterium]|nr:hypothetical protein [Bacteroidales bacterium]